MAKSSVPWAFTFLIIWLVAIVCVHALLDYGHNRNAELFEVKLYDHGEPIRMWRCIGAPAWKQEFHAWAFNVEGGSTDMEYNTAVGGVVSFERIEAPRKQ